MYFKTALAAALALTATAALAEGHTNRVVNDIYVGETTNNPNSNVLVHSYSGANYCPQGLRPVTIGGVICCGEATAGAYIDAPGKRPTPTVRRTPTHRPMAVAIEGQKGVIYK